MKKRLKIKYVNYGIACRVGNNIYINNKLRGDKHLHDAILKHEKAHSSGFIWNDLVMDFNVKELKYLKKEYYRFILNNPSSWTEFFPFWWYDKKFVINPLVSFIYLFSLILARFIIVRII